MHFNRFHIPLAASGLPAVYFCGNSLGLQPKALRSAMEAVLNDWAFLGVEGHFTGSDPWLHFHKSLTAPMAALVGALPHETVIMNTLTVNLHLLMCSFYRPSASRKLILTEAKSFPSDIYALRSQAQLHGLDPDNTVIELAPRPGEHTLRTEDILKKIEDLGEQLAVVMMGGVNYYTGQLLEMDKITAKAHAVGALAGFDLAHAVGNVSLELHAQEIDFAVWCSYKYLNAGPGGPAGIFVHENHGLNTGTFRLAGWWGHDVMSRFEMGDRFVPIAGAEGWQLSNAQVLAFVGLKVALAEFEQAGFDHLLQYGTQLQQAMTEGLQQMDIPSSDLEIITPMRHRGLQTSLLVHRRPNEYFAALSARGIMADKREPNVVRVAPVPLYNTVEQVKVFLQTTADFFS